MNLKEELEIKKKYTDEGLEEYLPPESKYPEVIYKAMRYSVFAGGKRLRPVIILAVCEVLGGNIEKARPFACAIEMIHTYSLIHDDLPALDNDDYRRGRLTTHKVYGEAMGVLSGVALLNYAYEVMLTAFDTADTPDCQAHVIQALKVMSHKTGLYGMLGGQSVDVENDGKPMSREMIDYIYENKTSALIEASVMTGAILGGATEEETAIVEKAAKNIGLAFQIQDDILDVTSTEEELGKPIHSDEKNHKTTYVTLMGIEKASQQVKKLSDEAVTLFEGLNKKNEFLFTLVNELVGRRK